MKPKTRSTARNSRRNTNRCIDWFGNLMALHCCMRGEMHEAIATGNGYLPRSTDQPNQNSWRTQRRINRLCAGITRPFTFARPQSQQAIFRRRCDDPARTRRVRWSIGVPAGRRSPHAAPDHLSAAWMRALHSALFRPGDGAVGFAGSLRIAVVYGKEWLHPYAVLVKYLLRVLRKFQLHRPQSKAAEAP